MNDLPYMGEDAFKEGFLSKKFGNDLIDRVNRRYKVKIPPNSGSAKVLESDDDIVIDLTKARFASSESSLHRLSVVNASTTSAGVTTPKVRVYLGYVAGRKADPGMTDPSDSPPFTLTLASAAATKYILCAVTVGYTGADTKWTSSACAIGSSSTLTAPDATHIYVPLAIVNVVAVTGGYTVNTIAVTGQIANGDVWVVRQGNGTDYFDTYGS